MIIGVDTGGTKTLIAGFSGGDTPEATTKFPTPQSFEAYVSHVKDAVTSIAADQPIEAIIVAMPGIVADGVALNCPNLHWEHVAVRERFQAEFPDVAVIHVENDANLGGLGETRHMEMLPRSSLYVTISTGIGTGIIEHGKIDESMNGSEAGHMVLEYNHQVQTWEEFASGKAIFEAYHQLGQDIHDQKTWQEIADRIARGFYALIPVVQPDVVIIGGSMGAHFQHFIDPLLDQLTTALPSYLTIPTIVAAQHPEEAVIHGCYYYARDLLAT